MKPQSLAARAKTTKSSRKVRSVRIQVCEGGWTCDVEREPDRSSKDSCCDWEPTPPQVFTDRDAMFAAITKILEENKKKA